MKEDDEQEVISWVWNGAPKVSTELRHSNERPSCGVLGRAGSWAWPRALSICALAEVSCLRNLESKDFNGQAACVCVCV